jgi:benzylsuccinate synthase
MANCGECSSFFKIPEGDFDFESGKGDCVIGKQDQKGKFSLAKPVFETDSACDQMKVRT